MSTNQTTLKATTLLYHLKNSKRLGGIDSQKIKGLKIFNMSYHKNNSNIFTGLYQFRMKKLERWTIISVSTEILNINSVEGN